MDLAAETLLQTKHASDLRDMWQGRALALAKHKTAAVLLSVLAHNYDDALPILLRVVFPGFTSIAAPFLSSAGKIAKTGHVVADMVCTDGQIARNQPLYKNVTALQDDFRKLADALRLSDAERNEMFGALKRWVVCDYRLDPSMDPNDPEAKRLVVH